MAHQADTPSLSPSPLTRLIDAPREQIADATALYFVMPTKDNVTKICQDCRLQLYEAYHFNFITPISRTLLEDLAKGALETNCVTQISKAREGVGREEGGGGVGYGWIMFKPVLYNLLVIHVNEGF